MVDGFSQIVTKFFDILVLPFGSNRTLALSVISLLTGVALIFLFKATSDQKRIKDTREKFKARILEMRIYQDDIVLIHKALFAALWTNLVYLRVSLKPILVLLAFVFLIFVQLDARYGRGYFKPGDKTLLSVQLKDGLDPTKTSFDLSAPGNGGSRGLSVDSPPVRSSAEGSIYWRIRVDGAGQHELDVKVLDDTYELPVTAERSNAAIGFVRTAGSFSNSLLHPGLPRIPKDSPIKSVELRYPSASYSLFGWQTHWLVVFIIFSFVGALIPKFVFKIQI